METPWEWRKTPRWWQEEDKGFINTKAKYYMKKMYAKQQSGWDSDLDSSDEESRKSGMSRTEEMYVLASAGINPFNDNIEFSRYDLKRYKKQAKRFFKNKSWW